MGDRSSIHCAGPGPARFATVHWYTGCPAAVNWDLREERVPAWRGPRSALALGGGRRARARGGRARAEGVLRRGHDLRRVGVRLDDAMVDLGGGLEVADRDERVLGADETAPGPVRFRSQRGAGQVHVDRLVAPPGR